jgi:hypothetical protein
MVIWRQRSCRSYQNGVLLFQDELLERKGEVGIFFPRIIGGNTFQKSKKCLLVRKKEEKKIIRPLFVFIWKDTGPKRTTNGWKRGILWRYVSIRAIIRLNIHSISYQSTVRVAGNFFFSKFCNMKYTTLFILNSWQLCYTLQLWWQRFWPASLCWKYLDHLLSTEEIPRKLRSGTKDC